MLNRITSLFYPSKNYLWVLLWTFSHSMVSGQNQTISFEHISIEDGLSHSNVQTIIQDKIGYIWFGTYDGLNRYNGYSIDRYKSDPGDSTSLQDSNIYSMLIDNEGVLWIGTKYGGLSRFDEPTETFTTWTNDLQDKNSLGNNWVVSMLQDAEGTLWLGTGNGLEQVKKDNAKTAHQGLSFTTYGADSHIPLKIYKIDQFEPSKLWLSTSKGLMTFDISIKELRPLLYSFKYDEIRIKDITAGVIRWGEKKSLIGTDRGLFIKADDNDILAPAYADSGNNPEPITSQVNRLIKDREGRIWIGTNNSLFQIEPTATMATKIVQDYNNNSSLSQNHIHDIFEDRQGIIWLGTLGGGVNKYDPNKYKFKRRLPFINQSKNQQIRSFKSAYQVRNGDILIGTDFGLHRFSKAQGSFEHIETLQAKGTDELGLSDGGVTSMVETEEGELFIGHWGSGLDMIDKSLEVIKYPFDLNESLTSSDGLSCCIISMKMDSKGDLWIGSIYGFLQKFQPKTKTLESFKIGEWIWDIEIDTVRNKIWCATENGFCSFDMKSQAVKCYESDITSPGSISHNRTWSVYTDNQGRLWVSTYNGMELFDPATGRFTLYTDPGINDFNVFSINQDDQGVFWLGTQRGISKFDFRDSSFVHFTAADGVFPDPHWSYRDREGLMYFGGVNGVNVFDPKEIIINTQEPTLVFTEFKLFNKTIEPSETGPIIQPISIAKEIYLDYSQNVFSVDFAALNYTSSEKNNYAYRLVGFADDWTYIGSDRSVSYTNLNPGNYTLQVKGSNNDKVWNENGISIIINITPPFWNTWWFRAMIILFVFIAVIFWIKLRVRLIKAKKKELEKLVVTRTSELQRANQALEEQKEEISAKNIDLEVMAKEVETSSQMKINFFTNISHELRTPLSLILGPLEKLLGELKSNNKYGSTLSMMHTNSLRLLKLINQLLDLSKLDGGFMQLQISKGDLGAFVSEIHSSFQFMADKGSIEYEFENNLKDTSAFFDADKVEKILFNVISNAFKFTEAGGKIKLSLEGVFDPENRLTKAHIVVEDTGAGIDDEDLEKIFERFEKGKAKQGLPYLQGKGIGLSLARSLAELHLGSIQVNSQVGIGTRFDITLNVSGLGFSNSQMLPHTIKADHYVSQVAHEHLIGKQDDIEVSRTMQFDPDLPFILLAEDNYELRTFTSLELSGYFNVLAAENGEAAWQMCLEHQPDIVLSDIMMPKMDGNELCSKIKADHRTSHIIVMLLTAKANNMDQLKGFELGADDYIMKPFSIQLLKLKVKNLLETRHRMQEKYQAFGIIPKLTTNNARDEAVIEKAVSIVEQHLSNASLDPKMISKEIGLSRSLLYTKIKSLTGMSVSEFVKDIRLKKAAHLLTIHRDIAISELSNEVGFSNHSHFTRSFKEKFGQSPSDYLVAHTAD